MKKALIWIVFYFSLSSFIGILKTNFGIWLGFIPTVALYSIVGWLVTTLCKKVDVKTVEKEAYSKGMSIRQYVASIVPSSLMNFCEINKGNKRVIKENIKRFKAAQDDETKIPKRIFVVLLEMYK